jgi:peptidoglycan hydrolase-like protein with peptidoglycan-binding domain
MIVTSIANVDTANTSISEQESQTQFNYSQDNQSIESVTLPAEIFLPILTISQAGEAVRFLQKRLRAFEYRIAVNGQFGLQTDAALKHFQARYEDLLVDGVVGSKTWKALCENEYPYGFSFYAESVPTSYPYDLDMPMLRIGMKGEAVECLQLRLQSSGYLIKVDGIFGEKTRMSVEGFQKRSDLELDGIVGRKTWRSLAE